MTEDIQANDGGGPPRSAGQCLIAAGCCYGLRWLMSDDCVKEASDLV